MSAFDGVASTWDEKPGQVERTRAVAERLRSVLDFEELKQRWSTAPVPDN